MSTLAVENDPAAVGVKTYTFKLIGNTRERTIVCPRSSWSQALEYIKNNELPTFKDSNPRLRFVSAR